MMHLAARRVAMLIPLLLFISVLVFGLIVLVPGDPAVSLAGDNPSPERIAEMRELMGLNEPLWRQYLDWLGGAVTLDLGVSFYSSQSVWGAIAARLPATLSLVVVTLGFALITGLAAGTLAGLRPGGYLDRFATIGASAGLAIPNFWLGLVLIIFVALNAGALPPGGYSALGEGPVEWLRHLILPAVALGAAPAAELARQSRASISDVMKEDYIRTAKAKGLTPSKVIGKHVLKNAAVPVVTVVGLQASRLVGGALVIEQAFALPGIGSLAYRSVFARDFPMVQGIVMVSAVIVVLTNLLVDLSYGYFNPKIARA